MKSRLRIIFWLMSLCMLGINGFQAYWLHSTYQLTKAQFARTAHEALLTVLQQQQLAELQALLQPAVSNQAYAHVALPTQPVTEAGRAELRQLLRVGSRYPANSPAARRQEDSVAQAWAKFLLRTAGTPPTLNLARLATAYKAELRQRGAEAAFLFDTVATAADLRQQPVPPAGYSVQTPPVALPALPRVAVRASFQPPWPYALRHMGGLLAGSFGLLCLTTACFALMLSTILRQKKLSEIREDFVNNMTHELKTPLATVAAAVEALQHFGALQNPEKTQTYLAISQHELQRLSGLVDHVLHMAVAERQPLRLQPETVQPAELIAELVEQHQLTTAKAVRFAVHVAPDAIHCDPLHLRNVISNLIDNAIKYSREQVTITIQGQPENVGWRLTVTDDGIGIPKSYQPAVFDRFFRVPTGNLHLVKGFGLGLYYVRQVIERHGGRLQVQSEPGSGSAFSFWLPSL
ncbi:HAMP domain-containing histidine kinase [Hymenobacter tibetensis]|uniref:histidine kinase n=1 Tax=Hymenobacter tibetensis TaxID=497967 RepID=A0ABY4D8P0_9BACT|nr:HAMP domain-containing sensor histidine kinase [Hymenobacter tibetensis]UOG76403.1 HAMP domain-containing histidine kinase [Hymenobacter tibetensis]